VEARVRVVVRNITIVRKASKRCSGEWIQVTTTTQRVRRFRVWGSQVTLNCQKGLEPHLPVRCVEARGPRENIPVVQLRRIEHVVGQCWATYPWTFVFYIAFGVVNIAVSRSYERIGLKPKIRGWINRAYKCDALLSSKILRAVLINTKDSGLVKTSNAGLVCSVYHTAGIEDGVLAARFYDDIRSKLDWTLINRGNDR
jgi:hypothetical protein